MQKQFKEDSPSNLSALKSKKLSLPISVGSMQNNLFKQAQQIQQNSKNNQYSQSKTLKAQNSNSLQNGNLLQNSSLQHIQVSTFEKVKIEKSLESQQDNMQQENNSNLEYMSEQNKITPLSEKFTRLNFDQEMNRKGKNVDNLEIQEEIQSPFNFDNLQVPEPHTAKMIGQQKKSYLDPRNIFGQSSLQKLTQKINTIFEENEHESHREEKQILKDNDEQQSKNQTDQKSELESKDKQADFQLNNHQFLIDQQELQITGEKPQTKCKDWMQIQWRRFKFYPNSPFKIKWDLFVILLSIYNSILVPFNFAFPNVLGVIPILQVFEYLIDVCFAFDIVVNFRSVYMNQQTEQYVTDGKAIALNYILKGRFVIDLFASLPVEEIFDLFNISAQVSKSNLKLISLFKLVRLLRLGRIITFLKMNQNFKQSLKIVQLFFMLIMVLHWIACLWYYVTNLEQTWMPQKDSLKSIDQIYMYTKDDYGDYCKIKINMKVIFKLFILVKQKHQKFLYIIEKISFRTK